MPKRRKNLKNLEKAKSVSANTSPASLKKPRLNPRERQLSRFYEPLVLLYTLGSTRGEHTAAALSPDENICELPLKELRRRFLNELAYVCDYNKGGDTVTAIGLESTPQRYVFWVGANTSPQKKIVPFLEALLAKLRGISSAATSKVQEEADNIAIECIKFGTLRINKYRQLLKPLLKKCQENLAKSQSEESRFRDPSYSSAPSRISLRLLISVYSSVTGLAEWLKRLEDLQREPTSLCRFAYDSRKSEFMRLLATLSVEPPYKSSRDAVHITFGLMRHYIGRLGHHIRAVKALVSCASRLADILYSFKVCSVSTPAKSASPLPVDGKTRLDSIIVRMLPAGSPDLERYQQALAEMDVKYQLFHRFLDNYTNPNFLPRVHAEIQVHEHFHKNKLHFADADRYIACSKSACFCCLLYFRYHPEQFVEPASHRKIYLNWRPPDLDAVCDTISENFQRDILNSMTRDIRREALYQIGQKMAPPAWHPDSVTGITESVRQEKEIELSADVGEASALTSSSDIFDYRSISDDSGVGHLRVGDDGDSPRCSGQVSLQLEPTFVWTDCESDSDQEGGVPL